MSIRVIAFGMVAVLLGLFLVAKLLDKKLKKQSRLEAVYAEIVFSYKQSAKKDIDNCILLVSEALSLTKEQAAAKLKHDKIIT
jgi:hypothetical protein